MRIAVVSDIHGNLRAFEAVLADVRRAGADVVLHGGDLADGGPGSAEIVDWIRSLGWRGVAGNTDQLLALPETFEEFAERAPQHAGLLAATREMAAAARERLGEERLGWLRSLPLMEVLEAVALVHASPADPWSAPGAQAGEEELKELYLPLGRAVAVYGHIHCPFVRRLGELTVANSGSVGLPYDGDPRASYLLIEDGQVEIRRVEYDVRREAQHLRESGVPHGDWIARMLETASPQMP